MAFVTFHNELRQPFLPRTIPCGYDSRSHQVRPRRGIDDESTTEATNKIFSKNHQLIKCNGESRPDMLGRFEGLLFDTGEKTRVAKLTATHVS